MRQWHETAEDMEILEKYLSKQDGKMVSENRFEFLKAIEHLIDEFKEYRGKLSIISEICIDESKSDIETKTAIKKIVDVLGR